MSNVCAKPGCGDSVHLWLDFVANEQRVLERGSRGDSSFGLCEAHATRFSVPQGWTFERLDHSPGTVERSETTLEPFSSMVHREHTRERPWFLALTGGEPDDPVSNGVTGTESPDARSSSEPTAGSLLHRAFLGPDREADAHRAALDELESRRAARAHNEDGAIELPFPPSESGQHVAVS